MQCIKQVVVFVFLFPISFIYCGGSRSHESLEHVQLSKEEACPILEKYLKSAKKEVSKNEAFRDYLIIKKIIIPPDEPNFALLNNVPLRNDLIKSYHDSSVVFKVSQMYAEHLFENNTPRSRNINPLIRNYSYCLEEYFKKFCVNNKNYNCRKNQKYRPFDGFCTCFYHPKEGAASTPFSSFLEQNYADSISKLRNTEHSQKRLPLSRELSNKFFDRCQNNDIFLENGPSTSGAQIGVFLTQDITALAYQKSSPSLTCCKKDYSTKLSKELLHNSCDPIIIPKEDTFFGPKGITCMNFLRTQNGYDNDCVLSSQKQLNIVTSFVDLSQVYGNNKEIADSVRTFVDGLINTNAENLHPEDENGDFIFSDFRSEASPVALIFNVLFLREHNRIARLLKHKFPNWKDELIFQEARRWNIAQYQHIIFEWIKIFIPEQYKNLQITKYKNTKVSCATSNEFAHGIFRLHHQFIEETIELFDHHGNLVQELLLTDASPSVVMRNSYSNLVRSLFYQKHNFNGCHHQIRNQLFKSPAGIGMDIFSFDIQRGRDHGIQPYYKYVEVCLNKKVKSFSDLKFIISDEHIKQLSEVYDSVKDIDLYIGAQLEIRPKEFQFGPIGSCITNEQFYRWQFGDSFFYDNPLQNHPFTEAQRAEIRKASFSRILCNNGGIKKVSQNAFLAQSSKNAIVDCGSVPFVNIAY